MRLLRRSRRFRLPPGYFTLEESRGLSFTSDGLSGMPCSDCCHAIFLSPPGSVPLITANWPCSRCGKTAGMAGGYHHRQTCGTDLNEQWPDGPPTLTRA